MPGTIQLQTPRLVLRRHVPQDAAPLHERFGRDAVMYEYSGWNPYATPEDAARAVAELIASYDDPRSYAWAVEREGRLVGTVGAYDYDPASGSIEVGMSIEQASWGKGFATEALAAVLRYLADEEGIAVVTAWCAADNVGSWRAMEKAGMRRVRTEPAGLTVGDVTFDKLIYEYRRA